MRHAATELEPTRKARSRLRMIQHYEQVRHSVSRTCRGARRKEGVTRERSRERQGWFNRRSCAVGAQSLSSRSQGTSC
jgi:hypothetical protein